MVVFTGATSHPSGVVFQVLCSLQVPRAHTSLVPLYVMGVTIPLPPMLLLQLLVVVVVVVRPVPLRGLGLLVAAPHVHLSQHVAPGPGTPLDLGHPTKPRPGRPITDRTDVKGDGMEGRRRAWHWGGV